ncbi:hypothetical protein F3Y22_tig00110511pilonHSYRG00005 [Hibiscus syriacus]|uniref:Uncharacterized protein n=1 Tax=Hibiscus syriacus TaxID=106335 RepID=A0A6A3ACQ5_HIBSY|nr:hypothetical protein F3Y22_tig00110511pilonHSYRG00005 [Hibiscus syriacus]
MQAQKRDVTFSTAVYKTGNDDLNVDPPLSMMDLNVDPPLFMMDLNVDPPLSMMDLNVDPPISVMDLNVDPDLPHSSIESSKKLNNFFSL